MADPQHAGAWNLLYQVYTQRGRIDQSLECLDHLIPLTEAGPDDENRDQSLIELNKRRNELNLAVLGESALGWEGEAYREGAVSRDWLRSKGNSIEGGTSEVQLNIIAKRVLGLPDE